MGKPKKSDGKPDEKSKGGRPKAKLDLDEVEKLAKFGCSAPQIAAWFGVNLSTVQRRKRLDKAYREAVERGNNHARVMLQSAQYHNAVVKKNPTMQIWLGKQWLGQRDITALEHSGPGGAPVETSSELVVKFVKPDGGG